MGMLIVTGKVEMIEDDRFLNIVVREDEDNLFRLAANSKNRDSIRVKIGDFVIVECLAKSKQNDKGYYRIDAWIHTIDNITEKFVSNKKLADEVKKDNDKIEDEEPAPWN